ncbi:hypothetical protein HKX48_000374 [Thoreauomyces humboldtii]|nr:hypothetical protein HKX48_000374 [Thoreauomyces humboldtii]
MTKQAEATVQTAAYAGDLLAVRTLLKATPDSVNSLDQDGRTALHWACSGKHLEVAQELLQRGAHAGSSDESGMTALHIAAATNSVEIVRLLLPVSKTALDTQTDSGQTALHYAASKGHLETVDELLNADADPSVPDSYGQLPIHRAATLDRLAVVRRLKEDPRGKVNVRDGSGNTPLHLAAEEGHVELVRYLLSVGADPDFVNKEEKRPADMSQDKSIRALLQASD